MRTTCSVGRATYIDRGWETMRFPMRPFEIKPLEPIRSVADALAAVQAAGVLRDGETAQLRATGLLLPNGRRTGFVVLHGPEVDGVKEWWLPLPSSVGFSAATAPG